MSLALVVVLAVAAVAIAFAIHSRRRSAKIARLKISGGRKSLAMNLFGRPRF